MGDTPQQLQQQLDGKITVFDVSYFDQVLVEQGRDIETLQASGGANCPSPLQVSSCGNRVTELPPTWRNPSRTARFFKGCNVSGGIR